MTYSICHMKTFSSLLNDNDTTNIRNIAPYIQEALAYRNDLNNLL